MSQQIYDIYRNEKAEASFIFLPSRYDLIYLLTNKSLFAVGEHTFSVGEYIFAVSEYTFSIGEQNISSRFFH